MIITEHLPGKVRVSVFGEFTLADFQELENAVNYKVKFEGPTDLLFDLTRMANFTLDVAWEDIRFARAHAHDFKRIAVVTESQWVAWSAWISQIFLEADVEVFSLLEEGERWLESER